MKKKIKKYLKLFVVVIIIIVVIVVALKVAVQPRKNAEIITAASIKEIINIEDLSTIEVRYDGVATKYNEKNEEKVDYYVAYEGTLKAGIELDKVQVDVDKSNKEVLITLPEIKITETIVDESSIEYIFVKRSANRDPDISNKTNELCKNDIKSESVQQQALLELAKDNAKNAILALTEPFVVQIDSEYTINVQ